MLKRMELMTWMDVQDTVKETKTVVVPIGAIEMQGPHLPLAADSMIAQYVAEKVAENANVVLAPLITVGTSEWHKNFPGMIGLNKQTLMEYLRQYCDCLIRNGFNRIFFVSPHTFNDEPIGTIGLELRDRKVLVGSVNLWHVSSEVMQSRKIPIKEGKFTHAGEIMTSVIMAIAPETVKMEKAVAESSSTPIPGAPFAGLHKIKFQDMSFSVYRSSNEETVSGSLGDPLAATPEKGRAILDGMIETISAFLEKFKNT